MEKIISMLKIKIWIAAEIRKNLEWSSHHHHQSWIFLVHKNRWRLLCQKLVERESSYLRVKGRRYNQFVKIPSFTHKIPIDLRGMKSIILEVINTYTSKVDISLNAISRQLSRDDSLENNLHVRNLQSFLRIQCQGFKQKPHAILSLSLSSLRRKKILCGMYILQFHLLINTFTPLRVMKLSRFSLYNTRVLSIIFPHYTLTYSQNINYNLIYALLPLHSINSLEMQTIQRYK